MMRSVYSGVTGLQAHQVKMDIIGNNIANVNTVGFKSSRVLFQEVYNQTIRGASSPDQATGRGGTNPMQVGLGLGVGSIDMVNTRGTVQRTENPTDVAIDGDGYFICRGEGTKDYRFTRAGNFGVDKNGNLVTTNGMKVQGWQTFSISADGSFTIDTGKPIEDINYYSDEINGNKRVKAAESTSKAYISGNLDASKVSQGTAAETINPDISGIARTDYLTVSSIAPVGARNADRYFNTDDSLIYTYDSATADWGAGEPAVDGTLYMDNSSGKVYRYTEGPPSTMSADYSPDFVMPITAYDSLGIEYNTKVAFYKNFTDPNAPNGITTDYYWTALNPSGGEMTNTTSGYLGFDTNGKSVSNVVAPSDNKPTITLTPEASIGTGEFSIALDFSRCTMYSGDSSLMPTSINGYPSGNLVSFNIGVDGAILGIYSNGQRQPIGMIALATFENPGGLKREGENVFTQTANSGEMNLPTAPGKKGSGMLTPGALEMSNVDLSKEFTEMIVTQRGFQANSRIITTSDEMLQELLNIKR